MGVCESIIFVLGGAPRDESIQTEYLAKAFGAHVHKCVHKVGADIGVGGMSTEGRPRGWWRAIVSASRRAKLSHKQAEQRYEKMGVSLELEKA